jgi:hypothetical protein
MRTIATMISSGETPTMLRIPLDTQRSVYKKHAEAAADALAELLQNRRDEIIELGFERAFDSVGVAQYGDGTYFKDGVQLDGETLAELADAIFYLHIPIGRSAGDLPPADPS